MSRSSRRRSARGSTAFLTAERPRRSSTAMWTSYSARHAAQLIGLPESAVRSCIRDGLVGTPGTVPAQLSFRDLSALRTLKAHEAEPSGEVRELPRPPDAPGPAFAPPATADQWLSRAQVLEERDTVAAIDAYRRSLRLRPDCTEGWINLGRLFAERSDAAAARACFQRALELG